MQTSPSPSPSPSPPRCSGRRFPAVLAALLSLLLAVVPHARAAVTRTVTTLDDTVNAADNLVSLREAIQFSAAGDTVKFAVRGVITLAQTLSIGRDLTLVGPGARRLTVRRIGSNPNRFRLLDLTGGPTVKISGLTFQGGIAVGTDETETTRAGDGLGGAILNPGANLTLVDCLFRGNTAEGGRGVITGTYKGYGGEANGGAIFNRGTLVIRGCTFHGNVARAGTGVRSANNAYGGAIDNGGALLIVNSTLSGNAAADPLDKPAYLLEGGGIYNWGQATAVNCTIAGNSAYSNGNGYSEGGGVYQNAVPQDRPSYITLRNTLIAQNAARVGPDIMGPVSSQGHNLVGKSDRSTGWIASDFTGTAAAPLDPQFDLAGLKNNGGPTDTVGLTQDSAARDVGDDAVLSAPYGYKVDQRGLPRRMGAQVDIGAYERDLPQPGPNYVVTTLEDGDDGVPGLAQCTLRDAIRAANGDTEPNTVTFRTGLTGTLTLDPALGRLSIQYPLTLNGPGARLLVVSGGRATPLFLNTAAPTRISGLTLADGLGASGFAGGALTNRGMLTLIACAVRANLAPASGNGFGPAVTTLAGRLDASNCTFSGNTGGGLLCLESTLYLVNCTLSGNTSHSGAGLYSGGQAGFYAPSTTTLLNCTIASNTATSASFGGGGIYHAPGNTLNIRNTLLAGNRSAGLGPDVMGAVVSQGNNLIGRSDDSRGWAASDKVGAPSLAPGLGRLANNGGPTDTHPLQAGSPALNAGNSSAAPKLDQRGFRRPDPADIGAFEWNGVSPEPPVNVGVTPNSGASRVETVRVFSAQYSDPAGVQNLTAAYLLLNTGLDPKKAIYVYYDVQKNRLFMRNGTDSAWVGNVAPGSNVVIAAGGGQGKLHCGATTVVKSGNTLTVHWRISAAPTFTGAKKVYLFSQNRGGFSDGWDEAGTWTFTAP